MAAEDSGPRLVVSTVLGVILGLALWSVLDGSEPAGGRPAPGLGGPGAPRGSSPYTPPEVDPGAEAPRDARPPHAPRVPATPPRLEIPIIGVRAHVSGLGTTPAGALDVPRNWSVVGRWRGGSTPGAPGVAVLVGHVDSRSRPAVFHRLDKLQRGDLVRYVGRDGSVARFMVTDKERTSKQSFPTARVYEETKRPALRLITCGGSFDWSRGHYRDNLIVYASGI